MYLMNGYVTFIKVCVCVFIIIAMRLLQWNIVLSIELILTYLASKMTLVVLCVVHVSGSVWLCSGFCFAFHSVLCFSHVC